MKLNCSVVFVAVLIIFQFCNSLNCSQLEESEPDVEVENLELSYNDKHYGESPAVNLDDDDEVDEDRFPPFEVMVQNVKEKLEHSERFKKMKIRVEDMLEELRTVYEKLRDKDTVHIAWRMRTYKGVDDDGIGGEPVDAEDEFERELAKIVRDKMIEREESGRKPTLILPNAPETYIVTGSVEGNSTFLSNRAESIVSRFVAKKKRS
ncbi:hypothetical protein HDE_03635 [Halotydeus destructor]|nr:hypothetical protein HDE_03635 [Halotydeus destructor]